MASENVELVRSIYAAWERGDYSSIDWAHPEIEWVAADGPSPGTWTGVAGMAWAWGRFLRAWTEWSTEAEEYRELDDEHVLTLFRANARGRTSGLELEQIAARGASLFQIHDGKVTRLVNYIDRERAFTELGLSSEARSKH